MAGLLDSARDFERWLADIQSKRPISHPQPLDLREMYKEWLWQRGSPPPPYQAAQWPAAMREASAVMPAPPAAVPPQRPLPGDDPAVFSGTLSARLGGPGSANLEDRRTPISADDVANWLRNPYRPEDQHWYWKD